MKNDESNEQAVRRQDKLKLLRDAGINPYPNDFRRNSSAGELLEHHADSSPEQLADEQIAVRVAGRLMSRRIMGKASFAHVQDESGQIQLYLQRESMSDGIYNEFKKYDLGDIVGTAGIMFRTKTGELSIRVTEIRLLVKSLHPLPDKYHGLTDVETRYRQRYLDLMVNEESREVFRRRSATLTALRRFLDARGYLEIESPITLAIPGGATARPFITHHHALDMQLYLRVAQELAIKRCLVGGFEKVYELNRNFRNEGLSTQHNPEFTMLEYNETYLDYVDYMKFTEEMLREVVREVTGSLEILYQGTTVDFSQPFPRIDLRDAVVQYCDGLSESDCSDPEKLRYFLNSPDAPIEDGRSANRLLLDLFDAKVEERLIQPTFITGYPIEVSPLSRRNDEAPDIADRFELFVVGRELANGFSELNDAEDQSNRFLEQARAKAEGDEEAMFYDADYIRALEYGLPPNAGGGIGVDRLVMIFTNSPSIRDVLLFPHMRPELSGAEQ
jgi:lysyl-tRNA synthetase class 2